MTRFEMPAILVSIHWDQLEHVICLRLDNGTFLIVATPRVAKAPGPWIPYQRARWDPFI